MLCRLFTIFFILATLSTQASVAFSCAMKGGAAVVQTHCCCEPDEASPARDATSEGGCCQRVVDVPDGAGDQVGSLHTTTKLPDYKPHSLSPALVPALLVLVPARNQAPVWEEASDPGFDKAHLYLRTQRLRL